MSIFKPVSEAAITKAIADRFWREFNDYIESDVVIVGGGPSGLVAAKYLAEAKVKTLVIESNNYIGGGFWIGGYLMNVLTFRAPAQDMLDELKIPYEKAEDGLFTADGPTACSKLIASACDAGAKIINMTKFDDCIYKNGKVSGVVINWTPVSALPRAITCVDPIAMESKVVIDATGHDAHVVESLRKRGILEAKTFGPMDIVSSEDGVVQMTGELHPGLIVCGMAVATAYGIPRMGPTFGAMLLSGKKAAHVAKEMLTLTEIAA